MKFWQQGDVIGVRVCSIPKDAKPKVGKVLAYGEHTGHSHRAIADDCELFERDGVLYLSAPSGTPIKHEEHHTITLPPGDYQIGAVQEYDHFSEEARSVRD